MDHFVIVVGLTNGSSEYLPSTLISILAHALLTFRLKNSACLKIFVCYKDFSFIQKVIVILKLLILYPILLLGPPMAIL